MKITKAKKGPDKIRMKTKTNDDGSGRMSILPEWWKAENDRELATQLCGSASYLKTNQLYRQRQYAVSVRLYKGLPVYTYAGSSTAQMDRTRTLPDAIPTFNLIQSATDTLVSRITQNEPAPKFLTDGADYHERHLAQELNNFVQGEFYQTKAYEKAVKMLRLGIVTGTGAIKVYEGNNDKVCLDHTLCIDLLVDENDAINGEPQCLFQRKLVDRERLLNNNPDVAAVIDGTPSSYPDNTPDSGRTTTDQVMVVEGWRLASGPDPDAEGYIPGRHTIATVSGVIFDEKFNKNKFPFAFLNYSDPVLGFWGQGLGTQLFGNQMSIDALNKTIFRAIQLVGVPRVFVEQSSKVVKAHLNNQIGVICTYSGTKPSYEIAPCNAPELYRERDAEIDYGFRQCGVSNMQATSEKPSGLNSGEAIRSYDDINSDRFSEIAKKYENFFIDLAYLITDTAMDIAKRTGKYQTIYPNKDGTKEINLPEMSLLKNPFVIKCFSESSLPRSPAGRIATVTEQVQAGMLTIKEGRRLMRFPDLEANERLDNASEERIFQILDKIVEKGEYTPPDPFLDLQLANTLTVQYYNLYMGAKLEEEKAEMLRTFFKQVQTLIAGSQPTLPTAPAPVPTANPEATPTSPLVPNINQQAA